MTINFRINDISGRRANHQRQPMNKLNREQRKQQTQIRILNAALEVFSEVGFDAASLNQIANRCDVKKALVQYHFETKERLWKASIELLWEHMRETLPDYIADSETFKSGADNAVNRDTMREVFRYIIRFARDNPAWVGIMFREASTPGPRLDWLVESYLRNDFAGGTRFIELAQKHGLLPAGPPIYLLNMISGALIYPLLVAPLTEKVTNKDMTSEQSLDGLVDTLMGLLSVRA